MNAGLISFRILVRSTRSLRHTTRNRTSNLVIRVLNANHYATVLFNFGRIHICVYSRIPFNLRTSTAFHASVQNKFPTDITKLTFQLTKVCNQNKEHHRLLNDLASWMGLKTKDGSGTCVTLNTATETIPRKATGNGKRGGGFPAAASSATHGRMQEVLNKHSKCLENTSHKGL